MSKFIYENAHQTDEPVYRVRWSDWSKNAAPVSDEHKQRWIEEGIESIRAEYAELGEDAYMSRYFFTGDSFLHIHYDSQDNTFEVVDAKVQRTAFVEEE